MCLFNYIYHVEMCLFMIPEKMRLSPKRYSPNSLCFIHLINSVTCWKYPFINLNQLPSSNAHWCVLYICLILVYTVYELFFGMSYCYRIRLMFLGLFFDGVSGNRDSLSPSTVVLMVFGHFSTSQALYALVSTR